MKKKICILYSSHDGHTQKISEFLNEKLIELQADTKIHSIHGYKGSLKDFNTVVIGANIRYGKHHPVVIEYINSNQAELEKIKSAFFSVNLVARKKEKNRPDTNPYFIKFMDSIDWKPDLTEVIAGRLDYKAYTFFDRLMIKLIMKITKGPTKTDEPIEYTDWNKVTGLAERINQMNKT